ncbi:hypothetical protein [Streptomyces sp. DW26H14]|uniref:hypothetical protein n=1 Tax=Streptomyces sp. DW26H14 TaxID=3435395 RepID=UPI00403D60EC
MSTVPSQHSAPDSYDYEFELASLVQDTAPRMFAVVVEYAVGTEDADAVVVAWGHAHEGGRTEVVGTHGRRWSLTSPDLVTRFFPPAEGCSPRLVWLAPDVAREAA